MVILRPRVDPLETRGPETPGSDVPGPPAHGRRW